MFVYKRSGIEVGILIFVCGILCTDIEVWRLIDIWRRELFCQFIVISCLLVFYPLRTQGYKKPTHAGIGPIRVIIPTLPEIAPLIYPPSLPILVSLILFRNQPVSFLPTMILGIASVPRDLIPFNEGPDDLDMIHWILSLLPLILTEALNHRITFTSDACCRNPLSNPEILVLIPPLHQSLCATLRSLTSTSLLPAELQLLSVTLIYLLLHAKSPQAIILKSLLWGGGLGVLVSCGYVLKWGLTLSRVPTWRFKREGEGLKPSGGKLLWRLGELFQLRKQKSSVFAKESALINSSDEDNHNRADTRPIYHTLGTIVSQGSRGNYVKSSTAVKIEPKAKILNEFLAPEESLPFVKNRAQILIDTQIRTDRIKSSGRRKKTVSSSVQSLFNLTLAQATFRKFIYAAYVYFCIFVITLVGIRGYVERFALSGSEPIGWALGYLLGDLRGFRKYVVARNLHQWIPLPFRSDLEDGNSCDHGWIDHVRHTHIGEANTRLILCCYWLMIVIIGLFAVLRFSSSCEVDTRRKVFHVMMVAILLPATYVDPTFVALSLSLMLAIFLLLDMFRVSRLPPFSKSLSHFLIPFVDSRDLRGPVVVSHIFLLVGCAIPLWLTLSLLSQTGSATFPGWDVASREVSMVSGVICVGVGDAVASLIGRRYGHQKWFWGGSKSIEGSLAFATAVGIALMLAKAWLKLGGWRANNDDSWILTSGKAVVAACIASLAEAVITGVNDNVIVPIVLWLCVRGLNL